MQKNPPKVQGNFFAHSLTCDCEVDRVIEDHHHQLFCGECLAPMERVASKELPLYDQEDVLLKLKAQTESLAEAKAEAAREARALRRRESD